MTSNSSLYGTPPNQDVSSTNSTSLYGGADTPIPTSDGNVVVRGDLIVLSGNILTTATTGNIFPANAETINLGLAATEINLGAENGELCFNGDTLTLRCNASVPGSALIQVNRGGGSNIPATLTWDEDYPVPPASNPNGRWVTNCGLTATGLTGGFVEVGPNDEDALITTSPGSGQDLILDSDTDLVYIRTADIQLKQAAVFQWNEDDDRLNRINFQSNTGDSSGIRVVAPNATSAASATISAFNTNDLENGKFININARGSANPVRIQTGEYVGGVATSITDPVAFVTGTTVYATVNPAGTTDPLDLATKSYVDAQELNTTYTIDASTTTGGANFNLVGSDSTTDTIKFASGTGVTVTRTDANTITTAIGQSVATSANPTFAGATLGAIKVGITTDNTIDTSSGGLTIAPATGIITVSAPTTFQYAENDDRTKRLQIQSSNGNSSGVRVLAPNATTSAVAQVGAFGTNDINNGNFINLRAQNSASNPLRIQTGKYTAGVLGASTGITFIDNATTYATLNPLGPTNTTDLTTKAYVDAQIDVNTTYTIDASATTGGANFNLVGSDSTTDTVKFANGSNVTVTRTDANTITIAATDTNTTYTQNASAVTGGAGLNLVGSDSTTDTVSFIGSGGTTVTRTDADTITISSTSVTPSQIENGTYAFAISSAGVLTTTNSSSPASTTINGGGVNPTSLVVDDGTTTLTATSGGIGGDSSVLTADTGSLTWAHTAGGSVIGSVSGTWAYNVNGTTRFPNYTFPYADGAANTVLTTDGAGNVSWQLPGGGGSTFGNVSIGVDTDQTISTTSGNLILQTAAGVNAGTITLAAGSNGNITVAPNGTGVVSLGVTQLADMSRELGQLYVSRNATWTPVPNVLTSLAGNNGIAIGSSNPGSGNGFSPQIQLVYSSGDTTAGTNASASIINRASSGTTASPGAIATNQVAGTWNFDGYATSGWASSIATTGSGAGTTSISPLQIQGYAVSAFTDSAGTVTNAPMGFRVRGFAASTNMSVANRVNFIDHQTATATYKANTFNIQPATSATNYAQFVSTGHTIGNIDAVTTFIRTSGATAGTRPVVVLRNTVTGTTTPANNDGGSYRIAVAGSNGTQYQLAEISASYSTTGDDSINFSIANGDQTGAVLTAVTTLNTKPSATTIYAGTPSATPGATTVSAKLTVDNTKITAAVPVVFPSYTAAAANALTGAIGWQICISNSASGGNPNGMMAFWDTTNARWSYIHDNSAV